MSKPTFYYPVTITVGANNYSAIAPMVISLPNPLDTSLQSAILAQDVGDALQGMYANDGQRWRFALPYVSMSAAAIFANSVQFYIDPAVPATAPAGSVVYRDGVLQAGLAITPGIGVYTVLTPSSSGGGGYILPIASAGTLGGIKVGAGLTIAGDGTLSALGGGGYVLPSATPTTLGGVIIPAASNLSVDGSGNIDVKSSLLTTINNKVNSIADVAGATGSTLIGNAGPNATLKTISTSARMSVTDQGTNLLLDVPIATGSVLGLVKAGSGITIAGDGTISSTGGATTLTGDVTGSGSGTIATVLATTGVAAGTYTKVTVDTKGRVTVGANLNASDVNTALGYTAYDGTTNPNGFLTANQTITATGDVSGTGTTAITFTLASVGTAGTYKSVTTDAKGRVIAGTNPTTLAGFGITDAVSNTGGAVMGDLTFSGGFTVKGLPLPGANGDAANKQYVDNAVASVATGTNWKTNAEAATTATITLNGLQTIDGYALQAGDRVLVKNQSTASENGVYVAAAGAWARAVDADVGSEIKGMAILVINGTVNDLTQWVNTNSTVPTVGSDPINYAMLQGNGTTYTAGTGLTLAGNEFSITNTGVSTGTYTKVTVNAQGQVTVGADLNATDVNTALGYTAYNGTTNPNGFLTANQTITISGDVSGTGTTAITTVLANSGVVAGTYTKVTVDAKGRVTVGANLASGDITTALGFTPVNKAGDTMDGALNWAATVTVPSAATTDIGAAASNAVIVSGNVAITALGTIAAGAERSVVFTGTPVLTHNAASLILPTGANITVAAGDAAVFRSLGGGNWRCISYQRADGSSLVGAPDATKLPLAGGTLSGAVNFAPAVSVASAATTNIGAAAANDVSITGSTTITAFDTIAAGAHRWLVFAGALTLTHNATSLILPGGANITTAAGDAAEFVSLGGGNWKCLSYVKAASIASTLAGTETLTNKTLVDGVITNFTESGVTVAASAAHTVNLANGTDVDVTTNANFTLTLPAVAVGKSFTVTVNYGGAHTLTFAGGTIRWQNNTVPTATSVNGKADVYVFKANRAGTAWFGSDGGRNF